MTKRNFHNKILAALLFLVFKFSFLYTASAAHIVGGEVVYRCVRVDTILRTTTFEIEFTIYRDSENNGAQFDQDGRFGVFEGSGNNWRFRQSLFSRVFNTNQIPIQFDNPCLIVPPRVGVQRGSYRFNLTLPWSTQSYMITYQRCCRNNSITNIVDPESTGATYSITISPKAQLQCNNSPRFDNFPPIVICANQPLVFDHSATDVDGDQLVYEFCAPTVGGGLDGSAQGNIPNANLCTGVTPDPMMCPPPYDDVVFRLPTFSSVNPMAGNPQVTIDPVTGIITGTPEITGQFVVGVCVKEFRDGVLLSELKRDFQFNVAVCEVALTAKLEADREEGKEFTINSCGNTVVNFSNLSTDVRFINNYYWEFDINGEIRSFDTRNITVDFDQVGTYNGFMILNRGTSSEACTDTAKIIVNIFPSVEADFSFTYDTCVAGPVIFEDLSMSNAGPNTLTDWEWSFAQGGTSVVQNPTFSFSSPGTKTTTLRVTDINGCTAQQTKSFDWLPVPPVIVVEPTSFIGCKPANVFFNNLSTPIDETYDITWDFGDGKTSDAISPTHIYEEPGVYNVAVKILSPIGCTIERSFRSFIRVLDAPTASFTFTPEALSNFNRTVQFFNQSTGATGQSWQFGDGRSSFDVSPTHTYQDTGMYNVRLIVTKDNGCTDTAFVQLDVMPLTTLFFPNAFTPNNDGLNDEFGGIGFLEGLRDYELNIWNRWGELIFETTDPFVFWNGEKKNKGEPVQPGVYIYTVKFLGPRGEVNEQKGHVTLIR